MISLPEVRSRAKVAWRFTAPALAFIRTLLVVLGAGLATQSRVAWSAPVAAFPVQGLSIAAPKPSELERFLKFIEEDFAPRGGNTLILRVDFNFQYESHPKLRDDSALSRAEVQRLVRTCRPLGIRIVPQINLLGHQSWAGQLGNLLRVHPEFDETPWVKMPEKYVWPNPDGLYCKSYCPLHPDVHKVVFALVDEVCDAFETDAFHAGMDEVFYLGDDRCPRCAGRNKAELFADEVTRIRDHLASRKRRLWIWGDRLLDGAVTGLGEWEASLNATAPAIDKIPKDVLICDWHYERAEPTAAYFALKGFEVVTCPWRKAEVGVQQVQDMARWRRNAGPKTRERYQGIVQTSWSGITPFLEELKSGTPGANGKAVDTAGHCFRQVFDEIARSSAMAPGKTP